MTKIRRAAQVVEDLKTLGVNIGDKVHCTPRLKGGITLLILIPKSKENKYFLVKDAFEKEFSKDVKIIECSEFLKFVLE